MTLAIMQPYFFPYIGYFQLIEAVDKFILYDLTTYRKAGWMNRNRVLDITKKQAVYIGVPVRKFSVGTLIKDIEMHEVDDWRRKLLRVVYFNYKRAPFFEEIFPRLETVIRLETNSLHAFNSTIISSIAEWLGITTKISFQNEHFLSLEKELFEKYASRPEEIKSARITGICQLEKATHYINAAGGIELYNKEYFKQNGIRLSFIQTGEITYPQFKNEFVPHLSILDVLFHNGLIKTSELIKEYKLI